MTLIHILHESVTEYLTIAGVYCSALWKNGIISKFVLVIFFNYHYYYCHCHYHSINANSYIFNLLQDTIRDYQVAFPGEQYCVYWGKGPLFVRHLENGDEVSNKVRNYFVVSPGGNYPDKRSSVTYSAWPNIYFSTLPKTRARAFLKRH